MLDYNTSSLDGWWESMTLYQAEYRSKVRRDKSREAISLAMQSRWEEAAEINRSILELFSEDVEAYNRLGKALLELGQYEQAQGSFARALELSPSNAIAKRNLARLALLETEKHGRKKIEGRKLTPQHFLGESGKTGITTLGQPAPGAVLAKMAPGDPVNLETKGNTLMVCNNASEYLGQVQPRLALRLIRLMNGGNKYEAAVTSVGEIEIAIIIREVYQSPDQGGITSFPTRGVQDYRPFLDNTLAQYDLPEEDEEEDEETWATGSSGDEEGEAADSNRIRPRASPARAIEADPEDDVES